MLDFYLFIYLFGNWKYFLAYIQKKKAMEDFS